MTGINETDLVIACVDALAKYIEENGEIRMPLAVVPRSSIGKSIDPPSKREEPVKSPSGGARKSSPQGAHHSAPDAPTGSGHRKHFSSIHGLSEDPAAYRAPSRPKH